MNEVIYRVKRSFVYAGKAYRRGDEFEPQGLRNDKMIIEHMCRVEPAKGEEHAPKRKLSGEADPGLSNANAVQLDRGRPK